MNKEGIWVGGIVIFVIFALVVGGTIYFGLKGSSFNLFGGGENEDNVTNGANLTVEERVINNCSEYLDEGVCEIDAFDIGLCVWDNNITSCREEVVEEEVILEEGEFVDLAIVDLNLTNLGCSNRTNSSTESFCNLSIIGTVKNVGTTSFNREFFVYFYEASGGAKFINIATINQEIAALEEKKISFVYENLKPDRYWIQIKIDPNNNIEEADEDNNDLAKNIKLE